MPDFQQSIGLPGLLQGAGCLSGHCQRAFGFTPLIVILECRHQRSLGSHVLGGDFTELAKAVVFESHPKLPLLNFFHSTIVIVDIKGIQPIAVSRFYLGTLVLAALHGNRIKGFPGLFLCVDPALAQ
ncbi:hypothetical protein D3C87_1112660 [compost metagenome]